MLKSSKWLYKASSEIRQLEQMGRVQKIPLNHTACNCASYFYLLWEKHVVVPEKTKLQRCYQQES